VLLQLVRAVQQRGAGAGQDDDRWRLLPKATKPLLKRHGLYIPTLLYIWKASLPYDAPYESELRHRVAYSSAGDALPGNYLVNRPFNSYDEGLHMANMVKMAKSMTIAPPISLIRRSSSSAHREILPQDHGADPPEEG